MQNSLKNKFEINSKEEKINEFVKNNTETLEILKAMKALLQKHFPKNKLLMKFLII